MGMLQATPQVMLQGAGPVGYYLKVLKGISGRGSIREVKVILLSE
jgi:hypothetical protein